MDLERSDIWLSYAFVAVAFFSAGYQFADGENFFVGLLITSVPFLAIGIYLSREANKEKTSVNKPGRM